MHSPCATTRWGHYICCCIKSFWTAAAALSESKVPFLRQKPRVHGYILGTETTAFVVNFSKKDNKKLDVHSQNSEDEL